jgi:chromodomain-helicase-DNA-binding protein 1
VEHFKRIPDLETYEIPVDNLKPTSNWTVDWAAKDDAHLLIGIWRHGFGSWEQISQVCNPSAPLYMVPLADR